MDVTFETLSVLAFLIPGFASNMILTMLVYRKKSDIFKSIVEALIFSFIIYAIVGSFCGRIPVFLTETDIGQTKQFGVKLDAGTLWWLTVSSVVIPVGLAYLINADWFNKAFRRIKVTTLTNRENIWLDVFAMERRYIIVNTIDGKRIFGWPSHYSSTPEDGYLYLQNPKWVTDTEYLDTELDGIFLVRSKNIDYIEFTNISENNAQNKEEITDERKACKTQDGEADSGGQRPQNGGELQSGSR